MLNITGLKHTGGVSRCSVRVSARTETPASTSSRWRPVGCDLISQISPASATSVGSLPRRYGIVSVHHPGTVVNELSFIRLQRHAEPSLVESGAGSSLRIQNSPVAIASATDNDSNDVARSTVSLTADGAIVRRYINAGKWVIL
ncbi:hypothetical protein HPP92_015347 [Vanilla planifolia]|uniref:Uncharacterized protein n=1 Tax=Vanilla planifolia TaxID=51239 RepID=A0A835QNE0_VANPL|nr:hypothetical protein HPP92_015347 [Vanilla planifolia]